MSVTTRQREIYAMLRAGDKSALIATATRQAFGRMTAAELIDVTQGAADEIVQLSPELQKAILSDTASFLLGAFGLSFPTDYATRQLYAAEWITLEGTPFALSHVDDAGQAWGWQGQGWSEGGTYIPLRKNPAYQNDAWLASALAANPIRKIGLDPAEWIPYAANPANGDLLSIGAEGGLRSYSHLLWVPGYGLIHPASDYIAVNDSDVFDMLLPVAVALVGYYVVGPILSEAWATATGAAEVSAGDIIAGAIDSGGGASWVAGYDATVFDALNANLNFGMTTELQNFADGIAAWQDVTVETVVPDVAELTPAQAENLSTVREVAAQQIAPQTLPAEITTADKLKEVVGKVATMNNLRNVAQAVSLVAGLYRTIAGPGNKPILQRRETAPTTYGGIPPYSAPGSGLSSILPFVLIGAAFIAGQ